MVNHADYEDVTVNQTDL